MIKRPPEVFIGEKVQRRVPLDADGIKCRWEIGVVKDFEHIIETNRSYSTAIEVIWPNSVEIVSIKDVAFVKAPSFR